MQLTEILGTKARLRLHGMMNAYDEILSTKHQHQPSRMLGELLSGRRFVIPEHGFLDEAAQFDMSGVPSTPSRNR
jgi:hypothetical protein